MINEELKAAAEAAIEREDCDRFIRRDDAQAVLNLLSVQAQLVEALENITEMAERCDSWQSFPNPPIEAANAALARAKQEAP